MYLIDESEGVVEKQARCEGGDGIEPCSQERLDVKCPLIDRLRTWMDEEESRKMQ